MDNYIFITKEAAALPIADRLADEGKNVVVGMLDDENLGPDKGECRLSLYENILELKSADDVLQWMSSIKNKDEWFVMFDYGELWPQSEQALEMGFTNGIFPTEAGYELEEDREKGKLFAKEHYPDVVVAETNEFSNVDDAIQFLEESKDKIYVLKSEGSNAETVVPLTEDSELATRQLVGALKAEKSGYEKGGFTLEEKVKNPLEISPVMVFWDGEPLFSLVELENKPLGSGNIGRLTGGCQNLSMKTRLDCGLNKIAFPPIVYEMARKQPGVSIFDAGLMHNGKDFMFTEFCAQRWGWDGIFTEIAMSGDRDHKNATSRHFDMIAAGESPINFRFGASVRMFQTEPDSKRPDVYSDGYGMDWMDEVSDQLFFYCLRKDISEDEGGRFVSVGFDKDLGVATGSADTISGAVNMAYKAAEGFAMTGVYYRPKLDFLSRAYFTSIMNRWDFISNSGLV